MLSCNICGTSSRPAFQTLVLRRVEATYFQCPKCGFLQPEQPQRWLADAYASAMTFLDIGILKRNLELRENVQAVVRTFFNSEGIFLDYGGGYGMLVRLMRDRGYQFFRQDRYAENLFAAHFEVENAREAGIQKFELLTAFEVFEHLENPRESLQEMLTFSDNILFSTELQKVPHPNPETWQYILPEIGQHISLFSREALAHLAAQFNLYFYTNGKNLHLFTRQKIAFPGLFRLLSYHQIAGVYNFFLPRRRSLLPTDFDFLRKKIQ